MPIPLGILAVAGAGAAGGGGSYDLLETTLISSNTASVTFSSLGSYSAYKHLQIRYTARVDVTTTASSATLFARVNNNSSAGAYDYHKLAGDGSSVASSYSNEDLLRAFQIPADGQTTTNQFGAGVIDILDFNVTTKRKTIRWFGGSLIEYGGTTVQNVQLFSGMLASTSAITSFQLFVNDNFVAGSRFSLYGIK